MDGIKGVRDPGTMPVNPAVLPQDTRTIIELSMMGMDNVTHAKSLASAPRPGERCSYFRGTSGLKRTPTHPYGGYSDYQDADHGYDDARRKSTSIERRGAYNAESRSPRADNPASPAAQLYVYHARPA